MANWNFWFVSLFHGQDRNQSTAEPWHTISWERQYKLVDYQWCEKSSEVPRRCIILTSFFLSYGVAYFNSCFTWFSENNPTYGENWFTKWRKLNRHMHDHESSLTQDSPFLAWKGLESWWNRRGISDNRFQQQISEATKRWRKILQSITTIVTFLISRRCHREPVVSDCNLGNFLSLLNSEFMLRAAHDTTAEKKYI